MRKIRTYGQNQGNDDLAKQAAFFKGWSIVSQREMLRFATEAELAGYKMPLTLYNCWTQVNVVRSAL